MNSVTAAMGDRCVSFAQPADDLTEALSLCSEEMMEEYLEKGEISESNIISAIAQRRLIPVCVGSALRLEGIEGLLECISKYIPLPEERAEFDAKVYKRTEYNGAKLTHMKITGGSLAVRDV